MSILATAMDEIRKTAELAVAEIAERDAEIERLRGLLRDITEAYAAYRGRGVSPAPNEYQNLVTVILRATAALAGATVQPNDDMGSSDSRAPSRGTDPAGSEARNGLGVAGAIPAPCRTGQPSGGREICDQCGGPMPTERGKQAANKLLDALGINDPTPAPQPAAALWTGCAFLGPPPAGYDAWSSWVNAPVKTGVEIIAVTANPTPAPQPKAALSLDAWLDLLPVGDWYGVTVRRGANGIERITVEVTTNPTTEILSTTAKGG